MISGVNRHPGKIFVRNNYIESDRLSSDRRAQQQFSLNNYYGNSGGYREVLRVDKALLRGFQLSG